MKVEIDADAADRICVDVLKDWYVNATLGGDVGSVLRAIDVILEYAMIHEEYIKWSKSVHTS